MKSRNSSRTKSSTKSKKTTRQSKVNKTSPARKRVAVVSKSRSNAKNKQAPTEGERSFDSFITECLASSPNSRDRIWSKWPDKAHAEVAKVLEINDSHPRSLRPVSQSTMCRRLKDAYGISMSNGSLGTYARDELGRKSWSEK